MLKLQPQYQGLLGKEVYGVHQFITDEWDNDKEWMVTHGKITKLHGTFSYSREEGYHCNCLITVHLDHVHKKDWDGDCDFDLMTLFNNEEFAKKMCDWLNGNKQKDEPDPRETTQPLFWAIACGA